MIKNEVFDEVMLDGVKSKLNKNSKQAQDCVIIGDKLVGAKKYCSAISMYDKCLLFTPQEDPKLYTVFLKRSQCFAKLKNIEAAVEDLENAVESFVHLQLQEEGLRCWPSEGGGG